MSFDWKSALGNIAPMLATALGGPLAGGAVAAITKALGLGDDATDAEIAKKLAVADPGTLLELKKAEQEFAAHMAELGFKSEADLAKIEADDRGERSPPRSGRPGLDAAHPGLPCDGRLLRHAVGDGVCRDPGRQQRTALHPAGLAGHGLD